MIKQQITKENQGEIVIYKSNDGEAKIEVKMDGETIWLSQLQLAQLFGTTKANVSLHIKNIFNEGELAKEATVKEYLTVQKEGKREVSRNIEYYNLDLIISVGYRIKSQIATQFRIWATKRLREYIIKGFTMDDERLKGTGGGNYWKELLDRIRNIRSSEKVLYRQVLDLYATSVDYNPKSEKSILFFKTVQNKLHYASHGKTAAEVIVERANADKPFMGLLTFSGKDVSKKDIAIAKNYLNTEELKVLNNIVSAYFDMAEVKAMNHEPMTMDDWIEQLDKMIELFDKKILKNVGAVSYSEAIKKAEKEYRKYQVKTLSPVEKDYLETIKKVEEKIKKNKK